WEEEMLGECQALLHNFIMQAQSPDSWQWRPDPIRGSNLAQTGSFEGVYSCLEIVAGQVAN
ncbi:hypothetical protein A2U01_0083368, partial [Trifolium medium]|nr:hypothetical protein [Trifolium medium]